MCTLGVSSVRTTVPLPGTMLLSAEDHCWCCSLPLLECRSSSSPSSIGSFYSSHQEARTGIPDLVFVLTNKPHKCLNLRLANNRQWVNSGWMMNPRLRDFWSKAFHAPPPTPGFVCFLYEMLLSPMYFVLERTSQVAGVQSLVTQTLWWWQSHFQLVWARYCVYLKLCT